MSAVVSNTTLSRPMVLVALVGGLIAGGNAWDFGRITAPPCFFEMVRAGWVACF